MPLRSRRGVSATISVVLLLAVTVVTAGVVGAMLPTNLGEPPPRATLSLSADSDGTLALTHEGGDTLDPQELRVRIAVGGESLRHQPPVPFFAATGFAPGPTGAFNSATGTQWRAGETASLQVAGTNAPAIESGDRVRVRVYAADALLADVTATAG